MAQLFHTVCYFYYKKYSSLMKVGVDVCSEAFKRRVSYGYDIDHRVYAFNLWL